MLYLAHLPKVQLFFLNPNTHTDEQMHDTGLFSCCCSFSRDNKAVQTEAAAWDYQMRAYIIREPQRACCVMMMLHSRVMPAAHFGDLLHRFNSFPLITSNVKLRHTSHEAVHHTDMSNSFVVGQEFICTIHNILISVLHYVT